MRTILALFLSVAGLQAATTNVVFVWDIPSGGSGANGWVFYERIGASRIALGGSTTNSFTVTNWTVGVSRTFTVVATNLWGDSPEAVPYVAPSLPVVPANLKPAGFSFTVPAPGVIELSKDLIDWRSRLRIESAEAGLANIELVQIPDQPILFGRVKPPYVQSTLPKP